MASNRLVVVRGGVGIHPGALRKKISSNRGRAFSEPSLIVFVDVFGQLGLFLPDQTRLGQPFRMAVRGPFWPGGERDGPIFRTRGRPVSGLEDPIHSG
jgi:hypothetical protein